MRAFPRMRPEAPPCSTRRLVRPRVDRHAPRQEIVPAATNSMPSASAKVPRLRSLTASTGNSRNQIPIPGCLRKHPAPENNRARADRL